MIDTEDPDLIQTKVKECIESDPGAVEEETMIFHVEESEETEEYQEKIEEKLKDFVRLLLKNCPT